MERLTTTPFGRRAVSAGLLASQAVAKAPAPTELPEKWPLFHALCQARRSYDVTDRDLTVLNALLSFLPADQMDPQAGLIVFPSNVSLSARAHGMAESTLRRHLAALVRAGLVLRHDSPNGKRYARRDGSGRIDRAFGFDLTPLVHHADAIFDQADQVRQDEEHRKRVREAAVLHLRDAAKLVAFGRDEGLSGHWDMLEDQIRLAQRAARRKLDIEDLRSLRDEADRLLQKVGSLVNVIDKSQEMSGKDSLSERHYQNSNTDPLDSEPDPENRKSEPVRPALPLALVVKAAPDVLDYASDQQIHSWEELIRTAHRLRSMMGVSPDAWAHACEIMGDAQAAIVLACILQRITEIGSPGGYLRALTTKAANNAFSPGPMVMALLSSDRAKAA